MRVLRWLRSHRLAPRGDRALDLVCLALLLAFNFVLCQGVILGKAGLGPEALVDGDSLYGTVPVTLRAYDDKTPTVIETPRDRWIATRVRSGHLDLWNPLQGTGVPLAPDQGGLFSPLRLIHILMPSQAGYVLFHCVRLWIAAAGTFYFARRRGTTRAGALLAAVVFGFGGGMIAQLPFISTGPVCVLPWLLLAQAELLDRPSAWTRVLVAIAVAATLVAGHPTVAAVVLIGALAHGTSCVALAPERRLRALLDLATGWALGMAFASPYLLPFVEYVANGYSYKHVGRGLGEHQVWRHFTQALIGPALVGPSTLDAIRDTAPGRAYPYIIQFVAGTAAWILACVGLLRRRIPGSLIALAALGLALSCEPPPFDRIVDVPFLRDILPRYYWPLVMLPVACAAGAGADALIVRAHKSARAALRDLLLAAALFFAVALAALGMSIFGTSELPKAWSRLVADLPPPAPRWVLYHATVLAGLALVVVTTRLARRVGLPALVVLASADVVFLMRPHLREPPAAALRKPLPIAAQHLAAKAAAEHVRMTGTSQAVTAPPQSSLVGLADIRMTAPLVPARYDAFLRAAGAGEAGTVFGLPEARSQWADLAAVRFVVVDSIKRASIASDATMEVLESLPLSTVFENPSAFERARLFYGASVASSRNDAISKLRFLAQGGPHIDTTSLGKTVVLEPAGGVQPSALEGEGTDDVHWIEDEADEVILQTEGRSAGYVVLADTYYPGWHATVDGASATIFPADVGFRAVPVPAGMHTVRFFYRPASVWSGVGLLLAGIAISVITIRRERRRSGLFPDDATHVDVSP